jgi:hypothetical protein
LRDHGTGISSETLSKNGKEAPAEAILSRGRSGSEQLPHGTQLMQHHRPAASGQCRRPGTGDFRHCGGGRRRPQCKASSGCGRRTRSQKFAKPQASFAESIRRLAAEIAGAVPPQKIEQMNSTPVAVWITLPPANAHLPGKASDDGAMHQLDLFPQSRSVLRRRSCAPDCLSRMPEGQEGTTSSRHRIG